MSFQVRREPRHSPVHAVGCGFLIGQALGGHSSEPYEPDTAELCESIKPHQPYTENRDTLWNDLVTVRKIQFSGTA